MSEHNKPHTPILDQLTKMNRAIESAQMAYRDYLADNAAAVLEELNLVHTRPGHKRGNSALLTEVAQEAGLGGSSRHIMRYVWAYKALEQGYVTEDDLRKVQAAGSGLSLIGQLLEHKSHCKAPGKKNYRKRLTEALSGERGAVTRIRSKDDERQAA